MGTSNDCSANRFFCFVYVHVIDSVEKESLDNCNNTKKKTETCFPRSEDLTSLCWKLSIYLINSYVSNSCAQTQHTHTHACTQRFLVPISTLENLNINMHPHTGKYWSEHMKPQKPCAARTHSCTETQSISTHKHLQNRIKHTFRGLSDPPPPAPNTHTKKIGENWQWQIIA